MNEEPIKQMAEKGDLIVPDMNENAETQQEYFGRNTKDKIVYIKGHFERESEIKDKNKQIAELEAQIEKMKNCFNCAKGDWDNRVKCIKSGCVNKDKWELRR